MAQQGTDTPAARIRRLGSAALREDELVTLILGQPPPPDLTACHLAQLAGLETSDVDFKRGTVHIQRSVWRGKVSLPKGGRTRRVPLTEELRKTLKGLHHLKGPRLLYSDEGTELTKEVLTEWMSSAQRRARLKANGGMHILRHTFCSHLAMRNAPAMAIKELAGHANLSTTMRYMHLSPGATEAAIRLLDQRPTEETPGEIQEKSESAGENPADSGT